MPNPGLMRFRHQILNLFLQRALETPNSNSGTRASFLEEGVGFGKVYALTTRTSQARFMVRSRRDTRQTVHNRKDQARK